MSLKWCYVRETNIIVFIKFILYLHSITSLKLAFRCEVKVSRLCTEMEGVGHVTNVLKVWLNV